MFLISEMTAAPFDTPGLLIIFRLFVAYAFDNVLRRLPLQCMS
jgi:hypothetical protein